MTSRNFLTIDDFDTDGKTILVRVDLNSPMDPQGNILDDMRIRSHIATLKDLENAKVVLLAHQSRPGKKDFTTMKPHAHLMSKYLGRQVSYVDDIFGTYAKTQIASMENGDVIMLENVRFYSEESLERPPAEQANTYPVKKLAPFVDIFLNDAFAVSHRSHLSVVGFTEVLPSGAGRVMEKEIVSLDKRNQRQEKGQPFSYSVEQRWTIPLELRKMSLQTEELTGTSDRSSCKRSSCCVWSKYRKSQYGFHQIPGLRKSDRKGKTVYSRSLRTKLAFQRT